MSEPDETHSKKTGPDLGRRNFIRQSVVSLGVTVHEYIRHSDAPLPEKEGTPPPTFRNDWLRPPGAVDEPDFLDRCTKCGDCIDVCPYDAIRKNPENETPIILPDESPCQLCDDFPCIGACETEALLPVEGPLQVDMGLAWVSSRVCTAGQGCNACISKCPTEAIHMDFSNFQIVVDRGRCVGCGICQKTCGTVNDRVAIKVTPARMVSHPS